VNAVAPGPIWTPLNPFGGQPPEAIPEFGKSVPMKRPGQPNEVAPSFLFLACDDASYMTGQVLHPEWRRSGQRLRRRALRTQAALLSSPFR
jgi:NAD(P)-dependent dehydrogenase (short-subunit alcohol dehydrogenase family)